MTLTCPWHIYARWTGRNFYWWKNVKNVKWSPVSGPISVVQAIIPIEVYIYLNQHYHLFASLPIWFHVPPASYTLPSIKPTLGQCLVTSGVDDYYHNKYFYIIISMQSVLARTCCSARELYIYHLSLLFLKVWLTQNKKMNNTSMPLP